MSEFVALRGSTLMKEMDLKAHLAGLMELPHVAVLLGAGASKCAGGRLVSDIVKRFDDGQAADAELNAFAELLARSGSRTDIEASWTRLKLLLDHPWLPIKEDARSAAGKLAAALMTELKQAAKIEAGKLNCHQLLLRKLLSTRDPGQPPRWVFTTNYDLAVESAAEALGVHIVNGFVGLHDRRFDPTALDLGYYLRAARGEARFGAPYLALAKLHGSLTWFEQEGEVIEVSRTVAEKRGDDPVLILPSRAKYLDTIGFLQGELFRRLAEFVQQPDAVLLVNGYALSDRHLNRLLFTGLLNPTFHLVLCCCPSKVGGTLARPTMEGVSMDGQRAVPDALLEPARRLCADQHPAITFVTGYSGGPSTFERFVELLPDPATHDEESRKTREFVRNLLALAESQAGKKGGGMT